MKTVYEILRRPIVTEKSTKLKDYNQVVFEVGKFASKYEIRNAFTFLFNINPLSVQTMNCRGKKKRIGKNAGKKRNWKKAIINLKNGVDVDALGILNNAVIDEDNKIEN